MINLKNEIEKLKDNIQDVYLKGGTDALNQVLKMLDQYNIITAPKSILLSELIDKICETKFKSECWVEPIRLCKGNYRIRTQYGDGYWGDYEFYIRNNKIEINENDYLLPMNEFKWLYELWIAGTIIEDDLEEE